jgi:hypothetical protein
MDPPSINMLIPSNTTASFYEIDSVTGEAGAETPFDLCMSPRTTSVLAQSIDSPFSTDSRLPHSDIVVGYYNYQGLDMVLFYLDTNQTLHALGGDSERATHFRLAYPQYAVASTPPTATQSRTMYVYYQYNGTTLAEASFHDGVWDEDIVFINVT